MSQTATNGNFRQLLAVVGKRVIGYQWLAFCLRLYIYLSIQSIVTETFYHEPITARRHILYQVSAIKVACGADYRLGRIGRVI